MKKDDGFFKPSEINIRYQHWEGMPEYIQEEQKPHKTLKVHFTNEKDYKKFQKLIGQDLTKHTKFIWFPKLKNADLINKICIDENDNYDES